MLQPRRIQHKQIQPLLLLAWCVLCSFDRQLLLLLLQWLVWALDWQVLLLWLPDRHLWLLLVWLLLLRLMCMMCLLCVLCCRLQLQLSLQATSPDASELLLT